MSVQASTSRPIRELLTAGELVRDERDSFRIQLRHWNGAGELGSNQDNSGLLPPDLLQVARALSLPTKATPFGSVTALFSDLCNVFQRYLELPEGASELLAAFVIGTWFPDCTPTTPLLLIYGFSMDALPVFRILRSLCRRGLMVADVTPSALASAVMDLRPTLLITHAYLNERVLRLLSASSTPGQVVLVRGEPREIFYAKAISVEDRDVPEHLARTALRVIVHPMARIPRLTETILRNVEEEFQGKLFGYRLAAREKVFSSDFDVPEFVCETRLLGRVLGSCIVDDGDLQAKVVDLLRVQDRENRLARASDVRCVVIEAVLFHKREDKKMKLLVGEITETVNDLLQSRDEPARLSERKVGEELKKMGFRKRRQGQGMYLILDGEGQQLVERLARQYCVLSAQSPGVHSPASESPASN